MTTRMSYILMLSAIVGLAPTFNSKPALASDMQNDINRSADIISRFEAIPEKGIPREVLRGAKGLAIMRVIKAGFMFSGQGGTGLVVARTRRGWSGPAAIGTGGAGFGLQIGAEVTDFVIVLNTRDAVEAFSHGGNVQLGGDVSVAAGPVGRTIAAGVTPVAAVYTYSESQGLFAGVSLQGAVIVERADVNRDFYGRSVTPGQILFGKVKPPRGAMRPLERALAGY